jgi:hypothetical protein
MTVTSDLVRVEFNGNGTTVLFSTGAIDYRDPAHLIVKVDGVTQVPGADYGVSEAGVTFETAPADGATIEITRVVPLEQPDQFRPGVPPAADRVENRLDLIVMALQQLGLARDDILAFITEVATRALRVPEFAGLPELPATADRANKVVAFDQNGQPVMLPLSNVLSLDEDFIVLTTEDGTSLAVSQDLLDAIVAALSGDFAGITAYSSTVLALLNRAAWQSELQITPNAATAAQAIAAILAAGGTFAAKVTLTPGVQTAANDAATRGYVDTQVAAASFGNTPYIHAQHERAAGASGGTATAGSWLAVPLNTTKTTAAAISGASHDTGTFRVTLPAGTYFVDGHQEFRQIEGNAQVRVRDITNGVTLALGTVNRQNGDRGQFQSQVQGTFVLAGTVDVEMQYRVGGTRATDGLGNGGSTGSWGEANVFGSMLIRRLA